MRALPRFTASVFVLLLSFTSPAFAQYMFLDTNGDGANDASDRVNPIGPTTIDIWVDTSTNRDGSPATCDADGTTRLTIYQWEVVLRAAGGALQCGPLRNVVRDASLSSFRRPRCCSTAGRRLRWQRPRSFIIGILARGPRGPGRRGRRPTRRPGSTPSRSTLPTVRRAIQPGRPPRSFSNRRPSRGP